MKETEKTDSESEFDKEVLLHLIDYYVEKYGKYEAADVIRRKVREIERKDLDEGEIHGA